VKSQTALFAIDQCVIIAAADETDHHHAAVTVFLAAAAEIGARIGVATTLQQDLDKPPAERRDEILAFVKDQSWKVLPGLFTLDYSPLPGDDDEMGDTFAEEPLSQPVAALIADPSHPSYDTNAYHDYHHYETAVRNQATAFVTTDERFIKRMRRFENLPVRMVQPSEAIAMLLNEVGPSQSTTSPRDDSLEHAWP